MRISFNLLFLISTLCGGGSSTTSAPPSSVGTTSSLSSLGIASSSSSSSSSSGSSNSSLSSSDIANDSRTISTVNDNKDPLQNAEILRCVGKTYLSSKQYSKAAICYTAVLQVIEGIGGAESGSIRQRCSITLAECEIKLGNLYGAIARCSEVIDECPIPLLENHSSDSREISTGTTSDSRVHMNNDQNELIRKVLSQALYRRAIALNRLEEPELAMIDLLEVSICHSNILIIYHSHSLDPTLLYTPHDTHHTTYCSYLTHIINIALQGCAHGTNR